MRTAARAHAVAAVLVAAVVGRRSAPVGLFPVSLPLLQLQLSLGLGFELAAAEFDEEFLRALGLCFQLLMQRFDAFELLGHFERRGGARIRRKGERRWRHRAWRESHLRRASNSRQDAGVCVCL